MKVTWDCPRQVWTHVATRCPAATFFHLPAWADLFVAARQGRCETLHVRWPDGQQAVVPVALRPVWGGLVTVAEVGFEGGYGGILADGMLADERSRQVYALLRRRYRQLTITGNPFERGEAPCLPGAQALQPTRVLPAAPLDELRRHYDKDRRRLARRYQEAPVTVTLQRRLTAGDMDAFHRLYRIEVAHWQATGRSMAWVRPASWFQQLRQRSGDRLMMAVATVDGEVAGAELLVYHGAVATELMVAWNRHFAAYQVPTALAEACFAEAHDLGCRHIDSMPSGSLAGVDRFKASFGAEAWPVWSYHQACRRSRILTAVQSVVRQVRPRPRLSPGEAG